MPSNLGWKCPSIWLIDELLGIIRDSERSKASPEQNCNLASARPPTTDQHLALRPTFGSVPIPTAVGLHRLRLRNERYALA